MYNLCTKISYLDDFEHLINQYSQILSDKYDIFIYLFQI